MKKNKNNFNGCEDLLYTELNMPIKLMKMVKQNKRILLYPVEPI